MSIHVTRVTQILLEFLNVYSNLLFISFIKTSEVIITVNDLDLAVTTGTSREENFKGPKVGKLMHWVGFLHKSLMG